MPSLHPQLLMQALADDRLRPGEPLPFMRPDVSELPHRFEAVTPDTFIDDLCATPFPPAQRDASRA